MSGYGWTAYGWTQDSGSGWLQVESRTGRRYSDDAQKFLHRVLYLPDHNDQVSHIPLYNLSERFWNSIGDTPIGSSMFIVKLHGMQRPKGDGTDQIDVEYLVDFDRSTGAAEIPVFANIQRRKGSNEQPDDEVQLKVSTSQTDACHLTFKSPFGTYEEVTIPMTISHPIPPTSTRLGMIENPFFTFQVPDIFGTTTYEWRVEPQKGLLRYSLYILPPKDPAIESEQQKTGEEQQDGPQPILRAIYHHNGLGVCLSQDHSEGVLLLPNQDPESKPNHPEWEGVIIASLLGLLWRLRSMNAKVNKAGRRPSKSEIGSTATVPKSSGGLFKKLRRASLVKHAT